MDVQVRFHQMGGGVQLFHCAQGRKDVSSGGSEIFSRCDSGLLAYSHNQADCGRWSPLGIGSRNPPTTTRGLSQINQLVVPWLYGYGLTTGLSAGQSRLVQEQRR